MRLALQAAESATGGGDLPIGALVIDPHGEILALTANRVEQDRDPCGHAELLAIRAAAAKIRNNRLCDCILVVTLEPCMMCAGAILQSQLSGVVYGAANPCSGALISCSDILLQSGVPARFWWMGGICAEESALLLQEFFAARRSPDVRE